MHFNAASRHRFLGVGRSLPSCYLDTRLPTDLRSSVMPLCAAELLRAQKRFVPIKQARQA
jgi:hypothetical protein